VFPIDLLLDGVLAGIGSVIKALAIGIPAIFIGGRLLAAQLRNKNLMSSWATPGIAIGLLFAKGHHTGVGLLIVGICARAWRLGARWHRDDLYHGADLAEMARGRVSMSTALSRVLSSPATETGGWLRGSKMVIGKDVQGRSVCIPFGRESGCHTLVVGATGSGKTVTEAWIASRLIEAGHGAIVVDPKGDALLRGELEWMASACGRTFLEWTPDGPCTYNPYSNGTHTEIADKALAGEQFTEPHYLRLSQRYLGHAVRAMHGAKIDVTPASLMAQLDAKQLEVTARSLPQAHAAELEAYLDSVNDRQRRELAGVRDRLSILAESDIRHCLEPAPDRPAIDLSRAVAERAVVYFRLDADRRVLLSQMLAAAIVVDLVTLIAALQKEPVPTAVVIDEFSAIAAGTVSRLFSRGRSAGVSLILGTQELADMSAAADGLSEQVRGNLSALIAHRQIVPDSADQIAATAGAQPAWVTTQQTDHSLLSGGLTGKGTRTRGYEYAIHPGRIKELPTGAAAVITPGEGRPVIAQIHHPREAH
jgi:conjugal transfer pilus assembly protein TraD